MNFIDESYLKLNTPIANNVNISRIDYLFDDAINIVLKRMLGKLYLTHLFDVIDTTTDVYEVEIINLIKKVQAWYVCCEGVVILSNLTTNKGAQRQSGDYSSPSPETEVKRLVTRHLQTFEEYKAELVTYLCENKEFLPIFTDKLNVNKTLCGCPCGGSGDYDNGLMFGQ